MRKSISLLMLGLLMPVAAVAAGESSSGCACWPSWCCWGKTKASLVITVAPIATSEATVTAQNETDGKEVMSARAEGKADVYMLLDVAPISSSEEFSKECLRLKESMTDTNITLRQGVVDVQYTFPYVYQALAPSWGDLVSLHFIITEGGTINYSEMARSIQNGPRLSSLKTLAFDSSTSDHLADQFHRSVIGQMPGITRIMINKSEWRSE